MVPDNIILKAVNIHKSFITGHEQLHVLKGAELTLKGSEIVSIMGVSGAGKSTLLHILGALEQPTEGDILLDTVSFRQLTQEKLADFRNQTIGFVFQFHHLLPEFTALENVMMPSLIGRHDVKEATGNAKVLLEEVGLKERLHHKPGELSGGEQQRVAMARALVNNPTIVLADEPTGNLDDRNSEDLHELLWKFNQNRGMGFIIATHDESLANRAHRKLRLSEGKLHEMQ